MTNVRIVASWRTALYVCAPLTVVLACSGTTDGTTDGATSSGAPSPQQGAAGADAAADTAPRGTAADAASDAASSSADAAPAQAAVLFSSAFSTALGTSANAVSDGGKWDFVSVQRGPLPNKQVIPSTGLDFPTPNVLEVVSTAPDGGWSELRVSNLPIPSVGDHRYYRWYFRLVEPDDLVDQDTHPMQDGGAGGASNWNFNVKNTPFQGVPPGTWGIHFTVMGEANANNTQAYRWYLGTEAAPTPLNKHQTYRIEVHWFRASTTHYRLEARIYDSADELLYDSPDFHSPNGSAHLGMAPDLLINNLPGQAVFNCGVNGIADPNLDAPFPFTYAYEGAFCVRSDDWCGPYNGTF